MMSNPRQTIGLTILFIAVIFTACEREIEVKLPMAVGKIVVEGWIEQDQYPVVILTRNSPYFEPVDSTVLNKLLITQATVIVSDGIVSEHLSLTYEPAIFPPYVFKSDSLKGEIGKEYSLTVIVEGKTLKASTTIPPPVPYDSVWFQLNVAHDSLGFIYARVSDPPGDANYYRIFARRIGRDEAYVPLLGSVYDDSFFNGLKVDFAIIRGSTAFGGEFKQDNEFGYFKVGDSVSVRSCAIDAEHYAFWRAIEKEIYTGGNPFVTPSSIPSNIQGGLGIWGGYGAQYVNMKITTSK